MCNSGYASKPVSNTLFTQDDVDVSESQLLDLCSGVFKTQLPEVTNKTHNPKINVFNSFAYVFQIGEEKKPNDHTGNHNTDDDDDDKKSLRLVFESSDEDEENPKRTKRAKKKSANTKRLGFSGKFWIF